MIKTCGWKPCPWQCQLQIELLWLCQQLACKIYNDDFQEVDNDDTKDHDDICLPSALMQDCVKTSHWHILRDHHLGWIGILPYWEPWKEPFFIIDSSSLSPIITIIIATHQIWRWVTASKDWQHVRMRKDSELKLKLYHQIQIRPRSWGYEVGSSPQRVDFYLGIFFVEVSWDPWGAFSESKNFCCYFVPL